VTIPVENTSKRSPFGADVVDVSKKRKTMEAPINKEKAYVVSDDSDEDDDDDVMNAPDTKA
jgi:hypothetical protein